MSNARFFIPVDPTWTVGQSVLAPLDAEDLHHAVHVLRAEVGEVIDVVTPAGVVYSVEIARADSTGITGGVTARCEPTPELDITLYQGIAKGEKMDLIVRQAVEVGVKTIVPVTTARSIVRLNDAKAASKAERWRKVARAAAKQARRLSVPQVLDPLGFDEMVRRIAGHDRSFVLWEDHVGDSLVAALADVTATAVPSIALIVGPEGGLERGEVERLVEAGVAPVGLGPSILRTETAAVVACALTTAIVRERAGADT